MPDSLTSMDFMVVFTFVAAAFIYFLAPVLRYPAANRGMIQIAMYALIAYGVVTLIQVAIFYFTYLITDTGEWGRRSNTVGMNLGALFGMLKLVIYLASLVAIVMGLQALSKDSSRNSFPVDPPK